MAPQRPNLTFGKLVLGKLHIWEVDTWEKSFGKVPNTLLDFNLVMTLASSHIDFICHTIPVYFTESVNVLYSFLQLGKSRYHVDYVTIW